MTTSWLAPRYCLLISIPTTRIWAFNFRVNLRNSANSLLKISSQSLRQPISSVRWDDARVKCFGRHRCLRRSSKSDPRVFFPPKFFADWRQFDDKKMAPDCFFFFFSVQIKRKDNFQIFDQPSRRRQPTLDRILSSRLRFENYTGNEVQKQVSWMVA